MSRLMKATNIPSDSASDVPSKSQATVGATMLVLPNGKTVMTRWELVTPARAQQLKANMRRNRKPIKGYADSLAQDMREGVWHVTHQGVASDENGETIDAQHRLDAIILSGISQYLLVTTGLPAESVKAMDKGKLRTAAHALQIVGHVFGTTRAVAVGRRMSEGPWYYKKARRLSEIRLVEFMERHSEAIQFTVDNADMRSAPSAAAGCIARAYYTVPKETLLRFCRLLRNEVPLAELEDTDRAAMLLKDKIVATRQKTHSHDVQNRLYALTQDALYCMWKGIVRTRLQGIAKCDHFPVEGALLAPPVEPVVRARKAVLDDGPDDGPDDAA